MSGVFITFEGTEGSGKSTQIAKAAARLRAGGRDALVLREPGGTGVGERIRAILKDNANGAMTAETELLLMNASRAQLVREIIQPALAAGRVVLCDRFADSTVAYQVLGRGLDRESVRQIVGFATGGLEPDLTLFLAVPVALSESRRRSRNAGTEPADRFESSGREFFQRVERGFEEIAASFPSRVKRIEGGGTVDEVHEFVWGEISSLLRARLG